MGFNGYKLRHWIAYSCQSTYDISCNQLCTNVQTIHPFRIADNDTLPGFKSLTIPDNKTPSVIFSIRFQDKSRSSFTVSVEYLQCCSKRSLREDDVFLSLTANGNAFISSVPTVRHAVTGPNRFDALTVVAGKESVSVVGARRVLRCPWCSIRHLSSGSGVAPCRHN